MYDFIIPREYGFVKRETLEIASEIATKEGNEIIFERDFPLVVPKEEKKPHTNRLQAWEEHKAASAKIAAKLLSVHYLYKRKMRKAFDSGNDLEGWDLMQTAAKFFERSQRMYNCANFVLHGKCPDCGRTHTSSAMLCRDRVCPTCAWRLSLQQAVEMQQTLAYINDIDQYKAAFLTLTLRNCEIPDLKGTLERMATAWNRLLQRKQPKALFKGWARRVEITYNAKARTFHPHYHLIILMPAASAPSAYDAHEMLRSLWKSALRIDYDPVTDFTYIEDLTAGGIDSDATPDLHKAILETFKYTIKDDAMADMPLECFRHFVDAIQGKRLTAYGGVIKDARQIFEFGDDLDEQTPQAACGDCRSPLLQRVIYRWSFQSNTYERFEQISTATAADLIRKPRETDA